VCLSVCPSVREDISETTRAIFTNFLCMLPMAVARSSSGVVAIILCTSGFVDDIMFFYDGPYSGINFASPRRTDFA